MQKLGLPKLLCTILSWVVLLLPLLQVAAQAPKAVGISGSWPSSVSQLVQTTVRVTLNTSACGQWGQDAGDDAQLVLQQVTAGGGSLTFRSSTAAADLGGNSGSGSSSITVSRGSSDCTSFDFPVLLDGSSKHGNISARLLLPKVGLTLRLQDPILVHVPLLISLVTTSINVSSDYKPFKLGVSLSKRAPSGGASVQLILGEQGAAKVEPDTVFWPEGSAGRRDFTLTLLTAPSHSILSASLANPSARAVLQPLAAVANIMVDSPVVSFTTNLGYYRGLNGSSAPRVLFNMTGSSAFPTSFAFSTFLLPGSRPSLVPCHPLAPSCSVADQEAVDNVTISGTRHVTPGQADIPPLELPVAWGRLPPEAELRVGVRIMAISNCRPAAQDGEVAAIVFGTPPGHCPPGAVVAPGTSDLSSNSSNSSRGSARDRPTYTEVAALQELALVLQPADSTHANFGAADSADRRRMLSGALSSGQGEAVNSSDSSSDAKGGSRTLDLDPPFRPLVDRYLALLPPGPALGQLMLSSSRWGDIVVVDTTSCGQLESKRYSVEWGEGQQLWREYYSLSGQQAPCWIRVHVFTPPSDSGSPAAPAQDSGTWSDTERGPGLKDPVATAIAPLSTQSALGLTGRRLQQPPSAVVSTNDSNGANSVVVGDLRSSTSGEDGSGSSTGSSPSVWELPAGFVLYRSYTIRFVPLRPPEQLSLRAITFVNNASVVIACGVPADLEHLFVLPQRQQSAGAKVATARRNNIMGSNYAVASSRTAAEAYAISKADPSAAAVGALPAARVPLDADPVPAAAAPWQEEVPSSSSGSDGSSAGSPAALRAAPGVDVQIAYLLMKPPGSNASSSGGSTAAQDVAAASKVPSRLRMQQFSVLDRASNRTILWSRFTSASCAQDRYILLPMPQLKPDMRMVPELVDPDGFMSGVKIAMSAAAVALPGGTDSNGNNSGGSSGSNSASSDGGSSTSVSHLGVPSEGSSSLSSWLLAQKFQGGGFGGGFGSDSPVGGAAAAAAVDGGKGYGGLGPKRLVDQAWCSKNSSSGVSSGLIPSGGAGSAGSNSGGNSGCRLQLPGLTAELPIILTADEGRSSRTYTMLLYSNATAATAVHEMVLPQEAAAAGSGRAASSGNAQAADAAALSAAYFASRPADWPKSPAQSSMCSVCPNGTYSTRTDALECKVCPPGKYAASPFSTTCLFCPPGTFSYYWGAPTCRTCLPGTFAATAGSLFCDICKDGSTTRTEGATDCEVVVAGGFAAVDDVWGTADVAILLSFGLLLDGTSLESVSRSLTGINGSSEGIVGVLVRGDTASALNISLGSVQVLAVQQIGSRQLLVNVSAALPVSTDQAALAAQDLSADPLIQRLIDDPSTFLRTTQTLGAESASVQDITTQMTQRAKWRHHLQLHAILWPSLAGFLLLVGLGSWGWRRRRRRQLQLAQLAAGLQAGPADGPAVAVSPLGGLFGATLQQRGVRSGLAAGSGQGAGRVQHSTPPTGPGWFYGDGFMAGGGAGVGLARASYTSSDAGDLQGRTVRHGAGVWRDLRRLLSSRIRIVFKVQGGSGGGADGACSSASSPSKSSSGASEADSLERGVDEYRVKVLVGEEDGSRQYDTGPGSSPHHQHDLTLQEESFAARLRAAKQHQQL